MIPFDTLAVIGFIIQPFLISSHPILLEDENRLSDRQLASAILCGDLRYGPEWTNIERCQVFFPNVEEAHDAIGLLGNRDWLEGRTS
ncbi:MAG: hypothetical protein ACNFW9_04400 [Candidatus Kerfeldbacteria bacterium]|jgi:hypothetical protein